MSEAIGMAASAAAQTMSNGCGNFWVANSIASMVMGFFNRGKQDEFAELNREFQEHMQKLSEENQEERLKLEMEFRRKLLDLSRQYQQEISAEQFDFKLNSVYIDDYLSHYWPLDNRIPQYVLNESKKANSGCIQNLHIILLHTPILPVKYGKLLNEEDKEIYARIEKSIKHDDTQLIGNIEFHEGASKKFTDIRGGNSSILNIHYLMNSIPTLLIAPHYNPITKKMEFNAAVWEPQSSRPQIMPLFEFSHDSELIQKDPELLKKTEQKLRTAVALVSGVVRDSYMMLTRHSDPTLHRLLQDSGHQFMKDLAENEMPELLEYVRKEYTNILSALDSEKNPAVLNAYHPEDIKHVRASVSKNLKLI